MESPNGALDQSCATVKPTSLPEPPWTPRWPSLWPGAGGPHRGLHTHRASPASSAGVTELLSSSPSSPGLRAIGTPAPTLQKTPGLTPLAQPCFPGPWFPLEGTHFFFILPRENCPWHHHKSARSAAPPLRHPRSRTHLRTPRGPPASHTRGSFSFLNFYLNVDY